jgi:hypothetical protein
VWILLSFTNHHTIPFFFCQNFWGRAWKNKAHKQTSHCRSSQSLWTGGQQHVNRDFHSRSVSQGSSFGPLLSSLCTLWETTLLHIVLIIAYINDYQVHNSNLNIATEFQNRNKPVQAHPKDTSKLICLKSLCLLSLSSPKYLSQKHYASSYSS